MKSKVQKRLEKRIGYLTYLFKKDEIKFIDNLQNKFYLYNKTYLHSVSSIKKDSV